MKIRILILSMFLAIISCGKRKPTQTEINIKKDIKQTREQLKTIPTKIEPLKYESRKDFYMELVEESTNELNVIEESMKENDGDLLDIYDRVSKIKRKAFGADELLRYEHVK